MRAIALRYLTKGCVKEITALQYDRCLTQMLLSTDTYRLPNELIKLQMAALEHLKPHFYNFWKQEMQIFYLKSVCVAS